MQISIHGIITARLAKSIEETLDDERYIAIIINKHGDSSGIKLVERAKSVSESYPSLTSLKEKNHPLLLNSVMKTTAVTTNNPLSQVILIVMTWMVPILRRTAIGITQ